MKRNAESEGVVFSETTTVSETAKSEISKTVNSKTPVRMEKNLEESNGPVDLNLPGPSHQMIRPRILR